VFDDDVTTTRETNSLTIALSYSRQALRGQIGQDYGNLTDIGLGAHPDSVYAAQRLLSEAFSTSPQKSAQLRVQCEQLYTQSLGLL